MVGDAVKIEILDDEDGVIDEIFERTNAFVRPPIANIDCFLVMMSVKDPDPNLEIIDRFLVNAEKADVNSAICVNKMDLGGDPDEIKRVYSPLYPIFFMSVKEGVGLKTLKEFIRDKKVAFAGPSGSGKTSLLNALGAELDEETGTVSDKTGRGKHTTRHVEIYDIGETVLYDTPGFTSFEAGDIDSYELGEYFPEMADIKCRFDDCNHRAEPGCKIKELVQSGKISESRYSSYLKMLKEVQNKEMWRKL